MIENHCLIHIYILKNQNNNQSCQHKLKITVYSNRCPLAILIVNVFLSNFLFHISTLNIKHVSHWCFWQQFKYRKIKKKCPKIVSLTYFTRCCFSNRCRPCKFECVMVLLQKRYTASCMNFVCVSFECGILLS